MAGDVVTSAFPSCSGRGRFSLWPGLHKCPTDKGYYVGKLHLWPICLPGLRVTILCTVEIPVMMHCHSLLHRGLYVNQHGFVPACSRQPLGLMVYIIILPRTLQLFRQKDGWTALDIYGHFGMLIQAQMPILLW